MSFVCIDFVKPSKNKVNGFSRVFPADFYWNLDKRSFTDGLAWKKNDYSECTGNRKGR